MIKLNRFLFSVTLVKMMMVMMVDMMTVTTMMLMVSIMM